MDIKKVIKGALVPIFLIASISSAAAEDATLGPVAEALKKEILADIKAGKPPAATVSFLSSDKMAEIFKKQGLKPVFTAQKINRFHNFKGEVVTTLTPFLLATNDETREWRTATKTRNGKFTISETGIGFSDLTSIYNAIEVKALPHKFNKKNCLLREEIVNDRQYVLEVDNPDGSTTTFITVSKYSTSKSASFLPLLSFTSNDLGCMRTAYNNFKVVGQQQSNRSELQPHIMN